MSFSSQKGRRLCRDIRMSLVATIGEEHYKLHYTFVQWSAELQSGWATFQREHLRKNGRLEQPLLQASVDLPRLARWGKSVPY